MKNLIEYYYNLKNINLGKYKNKILIKSNKENYLFEKVFDEKEVIKQYNLTNNINNYYKIITNKDNKIITKHKDNNYVLLKLTNNNERVKLEKNIEVNNSDKIKIEKLWQKKCDYIEYQQLHIIGKYPIIDESIDYYIGLTETAITYLIYNDSYDINEKKYLSHKRINQKDYYNPLNTKIDYRERDLSEYLKYIFLNEEYHKKNIEKIIESNNLTEKESIRLLARMLYPSFYYDEYFEYIKKKTNEKKLLNIIKRVNEYENYLYLIQNILNSNIDIRKINWI